MRNVLFIFNPKAGTGRINSKLSEIIDMMVKADCKVVAYTTQGQNELTDLVSTTAKDYDLVVCSGGDGTLDEVVTGVMQSPVKIPVGYIPTGSTNDFGASLKIPHNLLKAAEIAIGDHYFRSDIGNFNGQTFVYVVAFGLFTEASYATKRELKNLFGHAAYILKGIQNIADIKTYDMTIEIDDNVIEDTFILGMVTNSISIGGFSGLVGKNIELDDGMFEVTLVKNPRNPVELNEIIQELMGVKTDRKMVLSYKTSHLKINSRMTCPWTRDGEYAGSFTDVEIENIPRAVEFACPEK